MKPLATLFGNTLRSAAIAGRLSVLLFATSVASSAYEFSGIVSFGDSLTDRGNTIELVGYSSLVSPTTRYDSTYYGYSGNSYGIEVSGRWSSGPTWVEYLNGNLLSQQTGADPVDLGRNDGTVSVGTNFAWAGSLSGSGYKSMGGGFVQLPNLLTQISGYSTLYSMQSFLPPAATTLYTVWSGGNDAIDWVEGGMDAGTRDTTAISAAANVVTALETLRAIGGRYFVVPNLPALGNKPNFVGNPTMRDAANAFVNVYNNYLNIFLSSFEASHEDAIVFKLDVYSLFEEVLANPEQFGFTVTTEPAYIYDLLGSTIVDDPSQYVFWDQTHPTTEMHQIMGDLVYSQLIPEPSVVAFGIVGAGFLLFRGRRKAA